MKYLIVIFCFSLLAVLLAFANIQSIPTPILWQGNGSSHPKPDNAILTAYDGAILASNGTTNLVCANPNQHP